VPEGERGEGQLLVPIEQTGKTVDLDLLNNVMRRPYVERFRLILNDLGIGFAARGEDIATIVRRSNPALRDVDRFLKILADQNRQLARLTAESDQILEPLARERVHVAGFIDNAGATAEATAERGEDLEADIRKFPGFLRQLRLTMREIGGFSNQALPVIEDFGRATPALTTATRKFTPFASASIRGLRSLGNAAEDSNQLVADIRPVVRKAGHLARTGARPLTDSASFLGSLRRSGGFEQLMNLIYNTTASMNGFDSYGHFLRSLVIVNNCVEYWAGVFPQSECPANFLSSPTLFKPAPLAPGAHATSAELEPRKAPAAGVKAGPDRTLAPQPDPDAAAGLLDFLLGP
jgi:ABC-type transporter Mla subunit MlaD